MKTKNTLTDPRQPTKSCLWRKKRKWQTGSTGETTASTTSTRRACPLLTNSTSTVASAVQYVQCLMTVRNVTL